ncbi:MAG: hypothetical protein ABL904_27940 [Hyphomicrobiaceae bacterium]
MRDAKLLAAWTVITLLAGASAASAAVRVCKAEMSSGPHLAASVAEGQKRAIAAWTQVAKVVGGDSHTSWRIANSKTLSCTPTEGTKVICIARARPCVIEQVAPGKAPAPEPKVIQVPPAKAIKI